MASPESRKSGYLPGLDGLRAIAILGVLATHDLPWVFAGHSNEKWKGYGGWGVNLFFAISGVLICWRLLEGEAKTGSIRLRAFYTRRLFRIQPAALVYLAVVALLFIVAAVPPSWHVWWSALLSYTNFVVTPDTPAASAAFLGHFWTLAVEEHFYILISVVFLVARKRRTLVLGALFALLLAGQNWAERHGNFSPVISERRTYWIIQLLLFPALLALIVHRPRVQRLVVQFGTPWVATLLVLTAMVGRILCSGPAFLGGLLRHFSPINFISYSHDFLFYGLAVWVIAIMLHPRSLTTRLLELRPLRFVGRLSYSLYLWHILFFVPIYLPDRIHSPVLLALAGRPWKYLATAAAAALSYYLIEKPMIRLGHRIAPPATAGHRDLNVQQPAARPELLHAKTSA